jgi:hypothetical protein
MNETARTSVFEYSHEKKSDPTLEPQEISSGVLTLIVKTQKWGVFLQSTEATPCGHLLK